MARRTLVAALVAIPFTGERIPAGSAIASVPWYGWIGGLLGLGFVMATVFASPKLGAGAFVALVVTASTITSLLLDNGGLMGFAVHRAGWGRIAGGLCMVAGVTLIAIF